MTSLSPRQSRQLFWHRSDIKQKNTTKVGAKEFSFEIFIEKSYAILLKYDQPYTRTQTCAIMYVIYSTVGIMQFSYDDKKSKNC